MNKASMRRHHSESETEFPPESVQPEAVNVAAFGYAFLMHTRNTAAGLVIIIA
jgi:hypothetical protein